MIALFRDDVTRERQKARSLYRLRERLADQQIDCTVSHAHYLHWKERKAAAVAARDAVLSELKELGRLRRLVAKYRILIPAR
jgi:hypothetical protein